MSPFVAMLRKQFHESRWTIGVSAVALFALGWLSVYISSLQESRILQQLGSDTLDDRIEWMRRLGIGKEPVSVEIIMMFWNHPFFLIFIAVWGIARGSGAVAAEVERGTMDLLLSRPISRTSYLASQVLVAIAGLAIMAIALGTGASWALRHNVLRIPPEPWLLFRPAFNLAALGLPMFGYTLLVSSADHVRWRPTWVGASLTLGGLIARIIAMQPVFSDRPWKPWLEGISIFKAYNPIEVVTAGETFGGNVAFLAGIAAPCILLAFLIFAFRDLPANG
jgi:ABC-2 type transport system permease protein